MQERRESERKDDREGREKEIGIKEEKKKVKEWGENRTKREGGEEKAEKKKKKNVVGSKGEPF